MAQIDLETIKRIDKDRNMVHTGPMSRFSTS